MTKKLKIEELTVKSFVTNGIQDNKIGAGMTYPGCPTFTICNTCQCSEAYTICCNGEDPFTN